MIFSNEKFYSEPKDPKNLPKPVEIVKANVTRINPKQAQNNNSELENKEVKLIEDSPIKSGEGQCPLKIPLLQIEKIQRLVTDSECYTEHKKDYDISEGLMDNDCVLLDSAKRYQSEYEQQLCVKPEEFIKKDDYSESDSES
jgi:hypothetical protein